MTYTGMVLLGLAIAVSVDLLLLRTRLLLRRGFWTAYAIVIFFQLITNAWLTGPWIVGSVRTGAPVVNYAEDAIIGWRLAHAPIEDLGFGFALVLITLSCWIALGRRGIQRERVTR